MARGARKWLPFEFPNSEVKFFFHSISVRTVFLREKENTPGEFIFVANSEPFFRRYRNSRKGVLPIYDYAN